MQGGREGGVAGRQVQAGAEAGTEVGRERRGGMSYQNLPLPLLNAAWEVAKGGKAQQPQRCVCAKTSSLGCWASKIKQLVSIQRTGGMPLSIDRNWGPSPEQQARKEGRCGVVWQAAQCVSFSFTEGRKERDYESFQEHVPLLTHLFTCGGKSLCCSQR